MKLPAIVFALCLIFAQNVCAQELVEKFFDWNVFKSQRGNQTVCYITSIPIKREGNYDKRGEPFFLVTDVENDADEITVSGGFVYSKSSNVEVSFGSKKYYLFPYRNMAWANSKADDIDIIKEMQKTSDMVVSGVSTSGKVAVDTYSLVGFAKAYEKLKQECSDK
jgi:hypothetical protein